MAEPDTRPGGEARAVESAGVSEGKSHLQPLLAIGTAVTTLAAVLGTLAFTGLLARLPRNHPLLATWAFALVIAGAALWSIAALFRTTEPTPPRMRPFLIGGVAAFTAELILAVGGVLNTFSQDEKPRISARFDSGLVSGSVKVSGLASHKEISIRVHGLRRHPSPDVEWEAFGGDSRTGNSLCRAARGPFPRIT